MVVIFIFTVQKGLYNFRVMVYIITLSSQRDFKKETLIMCLTHLKKKIKNLDYKIFINMNSIKSSQLIVVKT